MTLLDETGNLGELDDILYFSKKLYRSLKIPSSRIPSIEGQYDEFDFDTTRTSKEDIQFFMFISRLRKVFSNLFKEKYYVEKLLVLVSCHRQNGKIMKKILRLYSKKDNAFIEKMNLK